MQLSQYELSILVKDKPIREYHHEGSFFVEGRDGSEYKIRIKNNSAAKACFVVSVDGLSILDGKEGSDNSPGYLLNPWQTLDVACYKVDSETGAKFVFGAKDKSYSAAIGKGTDNVGVIAAMVFRERYVPPPPFPHAGYAGASLRSIPSKGSIAASTGSHSLGGGGLSMGSTAGGWFGSSAAQPTLNADASIGGSAPMPTTQNSIGPEEAQLGTVFGDSMQWQTQTVIFNRENIAAASIVIYYDSKKNLERRGVKLEQNVPPLPNPFPGNDTGCPLPDSWHK